MSSFGTTAFEQNAKSLAKANSRRSFVLNSTKVIGASLLGLIGLQTAMPMRALGQGYCEFCGPTLTCAAQGHASCCSGGGCDSNCPLKWSWLACAPWNSKYRCNDCYHDNPDYCVCAVYLGFCSHAVEC